MKAPTAPLIPKKISLPQLRKMVVISLSKRKADQVINKETGFYIGFDSKGNRKLINNAGPNRLRCLLIVDKLIRHAKLVSVDVEKKGRGSIVAWYYFGTEVLIDGKLYTYTIKVRHLKDKGKFIYEGLYL